MNRYQVRYFFRSRVERALKSAYVLAKTAPAVNAEVDPRPRPPVRESSLNSSSHLINNGTPGKYSLPSLPSPTLSTNQLMLDYDSLLSYLTLKYGSPGERESCLRSVIPIVSPVWFCHATPASDGFVTRSTRMSARMARFPAGSMGISLDSRTQPCVLLHQSNRLSF